MDGSVNLRHKELGRSPGSTRKSSGEMEDTRARSISLIEMKSPILARIQQRLTEAEKTLSMRSEENAELKQYVQLMNSECLELNAKLFEEANNQVQDALASQDRAERNAKEKEAQNVVLRDEVVALKAIVLNSTPSNPNRHLHPQLVRDNSGSRRSNQQGSGKRGVEGFFSSFLVRRSSDGSSSKDCANNIARSTSHNEITKAHCSPTGNESPPCERKAQQTAFHVNPKVYQEFVEWLDSGCTLYSQANENREDKTTFIDRIVKEDVLPCLEFLDADITNRILQALPDTSLSIDPMRREHVTSETICPLIGGLPCGYWLCFKNTQFTTGESKEAVATERWSISRLARARLVAACNLYQYLGLLSRGNVVRVGREEQFVTIQELRRDMTLARLGWETVEHRTPTSPR